MLLKLFNRQLNLQLLERKMQHKLLGQWKKWQKELVRLLNLLESLSTLLKKQNVQLLTVVKQSDMYRSKWGKYLVLLKKPQY
ncbi:hypothetical protein D3C75_980510 [compost metagenome]